MPTDPAEFMKLAAERNGLSGTDLKPWHLKVAYQTYTGDGKPAEQGIFEEWWASADEFKISFETPSHRTAFYITSHGLYRSGGSELTYEERLLLCDWVQPMPFHLDTAISSLSRQSLKVAGSKLECLQLGPKGIDAKPPLQDFSNYCFDRERPILRIMGSYRSSITTVQKVAAFQGRYIPQQLGVVEGGHDLLSGLLMSAEVVTAMNEDAVRPPEGALLVSTERNRDSHGTFVAPTPLSLKRLTVPVSPSAITQHDRMAGAASLLYRVDENGSVQVTEVRFSSNPEFADSWRRVLNSWRFKPALLGGYPLSTISELYANFLPSSPTVSRF